MDNATQTGVALNARQFKHLPFALDAVRADAPIAMKNGQSAEFVAFCDRAVFPLVVLTGPNNELEVYRTDGTCPEGDEYALVMVVPVETRFVNLFADGKGAVRGSGEHYATEEEALTQSRLWLESGGTPMLATAVPIEVRAQ